MLAPWVEEEMKTADLKDRRLNNRLGEVLSQFAAHPRASIPAACGGRAEMEAAYRLFDNEKVTFDNILNPHQEATRRRIAAQPVVILAQDTTEVDLTRPEQQVRGAGPLSKESRLGALLHVLHAFTPDGTPLGTLEATAWVREHGPSRRESLTHAQRLATPLDEKESYRWVVALRQAHEAARQHPQTQVVCVADSEADIYELLAEGMSEPRAAHWIVRGCQNRVLQEEMSSEDASPTYLREKLLAQTVLFTKNISVRGRKLKVACSTKRRAQAQTSRQTEVEIRAVQVALRPPYRKTGKLSPVSVNAVLVREPNPPAGEEPIDWLLLTSLPIGDVEAVRQVIELYCIRWMVEIFFRTLKSGCRAEERRFEQMDRQLRCLAVYLIVAWRTLHVCRLGRACPDISCEAIFEPAEWKAVYRVVQNKPPPGEPPPLGLMVRLVARLGGYVDRRRQDPPGPQTVWLGLQRMHDFALCWESFGPEATNSA
jgi:Transposase DNA-binding/Transposase Tn5 dimerisation domain